MTHLVEAKPIGRTVFFLQTDDGHQLKIAHGVRKYQPCASVTTAYARQEFAILGEAPHGWCQLIQLAVNTFNVMDTFKVLPPPGHIATLEVDPALEYIPALITDDGVTEMLLARQLCFVPFEMMFLLLGK